MMSVIYGNPITLGGGGVKGKKLSELTEGSLVSVLEDGKLTPFYVAKHNYEADLNGDGRTLLVRKDLHSQRVWHTSNVNAYATSAIDSWLNGDYKAMLSADVQAQMGVTNFNYTVGNGNTTVSVLQRSAFLLSLTEMGFSESPANVEGEKLPIASILPVAYLNGTATGHCLRTAVKTGATQAYYMMVTGTPNGFNCSSSVGIRPCFTLPDTMALNTEPYGDGSWGLADEGVLFDTKTAKTTPLVPVNYTNGIADFTPAQINGIAMAISANPNITKDTSVVYYDNGDVHLKISTGDTMTFTYNDDKLYTHTARIVGFNHDELSDGSGYENVTITGKAGMTFHMADCLAYTYPMNSSNTSIGGWTSSAIRNTYFPVFITRLTSELQNVIKKVNKETLSGGQGGTLSTTQDNLFLLSEVEVTGGVTSSFAGEGTQYAYYKAGNSKIIDAQTWYLRSPHKGTTQHFLYITVTGGVEAVGAANYASVAFAYCI